jgi:hypothetical protein
LAFADFLAAAAGFLTGAAVVVFLAAGFLEGAGLAGAASEAAGFGAAGFRPGVLTAGFAAALAGLRRGAFTGASDTVFSGLEVSSSAMRSIPYR